MMINMTFIVFKSPVPVTWYGSINDLMEQSLSEV
jgi:hypothetical protein